MQTEEEKEEKDFQPDEALANGLIAFDTLRKKGDFEKLKREGRVLKDKHLIIYILPNKKNQVVRAGFSIGKKTGKAFQRNKTRRILKEILRNVSIPFAIDVYIIARKNITETGYHELKDELERNLKKFFLGK